MATLYVVLNIEIQYDIHEQNFLHSGDQHGKLHSNSSTFFNICRLYAILNVSHHFLYYKNPIALFLTDTQISGKNSLRHLNFPGYELNHKYSLYGGIWTFVQKSASFTPLHALKANRKVILKPRFLRNL